MTEEQLERVRRDIASRLRPSSGHSLESVVADFTHYLGESPLVRRATVRKTDAPAALIEALCDLEEVDLERAAAELERLWLADLRYEPGFEAHTVSRAPREVVLQGITVPPGGSHYVTARIRARL